MSWKKMILRFVPLVIAMLAGVICRAEQGVDSKPPVRIAPAGEWVKTPVRHAFS